MRAWRTLAVNTSVLVPFYGTATPHGPQFPLDPMTAFAALVGSALITWVNVSGNSGRP
ncbi:hypothetical protein [Wenjunlia vitaminophila]|uniref:hypothetical protein n=1 Tax=Wenjunlia vitaminophila TaxID=76728 RepID=UPI00036FE8C6|nr:hypothetical protein [Wenjunlia vitaminophila]